MEVVLAKNAGFCFGVQRSMDFVEELFSKGKNVYMLGPLIHNPQAIRQLEQRGAKTIESLDEVKDSSATVIIRAHGVTPEVFEKAKQKGLELVNATCPFVEMVQKKARELFDASYLVVIVGERNHPEVTGIKGNAPTALVVENASEARALFDQESKFVEQKQLLEEKDLEKIKQALFVPQAPKLGVVSQTTQSDENFASVVKELALKARELRAFNTICNATHARQGSALSLAGQVDLMVVVGGKNSGNTKRLHDLCSEITETKWIETAAELKPEWFKGKKKTGVTAGASTPDFLVEEVVKKIKAY